MTAKSDKQEETNRISGEGVPGKIEYFCTSYVRSGEMNRRTSVAGTVLETAVMKERQ